MSRFKSSGFSLIEILIVIVVLGLTLVPAMNALQVSIKSSELGSDSLRQHYLLFGKMEEVLAEDFATLDAAATAAGSATTPSSYSSNLDGFIVYLSRYDTDNADTDDDSFTGVDEVIWVRTESKGSTLYFETLVLPDA